MFASMPLNRRNSDPTPFLADDGSRHAKYDDALPRDSRRIPRPGYQFGVLEENEHLTYAGRLWSTTEDKLAWAQKHLALISIFDGPKADHARRVLTLIAHLAKEATDA